MFELTPVEELYNANVLTYGIQCSVTRKRSNRVWSTWLTDVADESVVSYIYI